ncbi:UDP-glucose 6-dehydrogenase 3-like [Chenopodium quinoa]|uniref:UDP-glucose 6-dehydrogenase 3-like n=1 Tax=Chenopodium quinoa TaxID=63459 RepID=UPI000B77983E|nr:UDP-glucose 6-dehydrogenase 3-like [Chenopodium quinoa]XP_021719200.1 UDP-glucose 6-dehydrogenase 3-like [Chenopodium quinoa]XP_021719201.1 UDP-glucose 6-dehydrogenase 3-like [Chenopodium quinoa]XP_021719202.1 UDP-glucose 6-dehydrogenase 3-like [Chenopodium quinoa]XP_021719203.1 UDP-glucose 6-dehydrogenase 3-like [Chenopodium quinoa]
MAVLSHHWLNKTFVVVDRDIDLINNINGVNEENERLMLFSEPGMDDLLDEAMHVNYNLVFSSNIAAKLDLCRVIFIAVNIPLKEQPRQVKSDFDVQNWEDATRAILDSIGREPVLRSRYVVVKSTLPIDYKRNIHDRFSEYNNFNYLHIITNPEFFSEGTVVDDLSYPHKIVLEEFFNGGREFFRDLYLPVVEHDYDRIEMVTSLSSVELGKLLSNASISAQLTIMNIGSTICGKVGANFDDVKRSFTANPRVDAFFVDSRPGYGGLGLNKDVSYLSYLCDYIGLKEEMELFNKLIKLRRKKMDDLVKTILSMIGSSKRIAIYGFSNKVDTDDIRESPAIYICKALLKARDVHLVVYDPAVPDENIISSFSDKAKNRVHVAANASAAWTNTQAMVFLVEWMEFKTMLQQEIHQILLAMRRTKFIFDCCDLFDNTVIIPNTHFKLYKLGKPI